MRLVPDPDQKQSSDTGSNNNFEYGKAIVESGASRSRLD